MSKLKKLILLTSLLISGLATTAQTNKTGYYPLEIKNNSGSSTNVKNVYVILMGKRWDSAATNCALSLTYDSVRNAQVGKMVPLTRQSDAKDYTYDITTLKGYSSTTSSVRIYIPHLQSGRCMISVNYKLYMPVTQAADMTWSFSSPSVNDTTDVNNDIIYDKVEYTYDTIAPTGRFWINTTAVDFLSIPMKLSLNGSSSGNVSEISRPAIFKIVSDTITQYDNSPTKTWTSLIVKEQSPIRIISPSLGLVFDPNYLTGASYNYVLNLIQHLTDTLYIDCSEVKGSWYRGTIDSNHDWVFIGNHEGVNDTVKIAIKDVKSSDFFGPGAAPFDTPNTTIKSILVKNITAAFTVNFLPARNNDSLVKPYNKDNFYLANPLQKAPAGSGPWYNLYTRAIHAAIPIIYAFAYDDVLGQDGTINSTDTTQPAILSISDFGNTIIPPHKDLFNVGAVELLTNTGFIKNEGTGTSTMRLTWKNPPIPGAEFPQPKNALYYIMPTGSSTFGYTITADSIFKLQKNTFGKYTDTCLTLTLPTSCLTGDPTKMSALIMTFGGPDSPANGPDSQILNNAHGSNLLAPNVAKPSCSCSTKHKIIRSRKLKGRMQ